jgi:hypothetical protein
VLRVLLERWHSAEELLERDSTAGFTALHLAAGLRDASSIEQLVDAMMCAGADINTLSTFLGSPVGQTALDELDLAIADSPTDDSRRDGELITLLERRGAKRRHQVLEEKRHSLSFVEKRKANILSSGGTALGLVGRVTETIRLRWGMAPDARTNRERIESERNPEEIRWSG